MNTIKLSYDSKSYQSKPAGDEIRYVSNRIGRSANWQREQFGEK